MKTYIVLFISLIFLIIISISFTGMRSTLKALEFQNLSPVEEPLDEAKARLHDLYSNCDDPSLREEYSNISAILDRAGSRVSQRQLLKDEVYYTLMVNLLLVSFISLVAVTILWIGIRRGFLLPMDRVIQAMARARDDQWKESIPTGGFREMQTLQQALNQMFQEIQLSHEQVKTMERDNIGRFMAHQIKNSLTPIRLCSFNIHQLNQDPRVSSNNSLILEETEKIQSLIDQFRTLSRFPELNLQRVELNRMIQGILKSYPQVELQSDSDNCTLMVDPLLFEQAMINLIRNALEASVGGESSPVVSLCCGKPHRISVIDRGRGIPPELLDRIGDEDFTTKKKGMGIGLAFVRRVIDGHGFTMNIQSRVGEGTTVEVSLHEENSDHR